MVRFRWFLAMVVMLPAIAIAQPGPDDSSSHDPRAAKVVARIVVDLIAAPSARPWLASAFEQAITRELSGFERLAPVARDALAPRDCGADRACRVQRYREARIDIVLLGEVTDDQIRYELYQTWTPARLAAGAITIGRAQTPIGLKHEVRDALHPVLKHGGLLDQRPYMYGARSATAASSLPVTPTLLAGVLLVLALPFGYLVIRTRSLRGLFALRSARRMVVLAGALVALGTMVDPADVAAFVGAWPWWFAAFGGLCWGALVIAGGRNAFPPLGGFARVAHDDAVRLIRTWCVVVVQRFVVLAILYAPAGMLALWLGDQLATGALWTFGLVMPSVMMLTRLWYAAWVESIAAALDDRLVEGAATAANPWSREISDYLMGYVRRTGWDLDPHLLSRVVFLPGTRIDGVVAYGGGMTHARIVIDRRLLELALGELVEIKPAEKPALWPDWTVAAIAPQPAAHGRRRTSAALYRGGKPHAASHARARRPLGQAATLLGYVMPRPGERVPLISDNPQDLAVVRSLLSEHYLWDAPDPDEEFDATDPTDKDFLFGALVRGLGVVERQECQLQTIKIALGAWIANAMTRAQARLADAYPALNFARHHFVQYLYYLWSRDPELLTARARIARLHDTSIRIFERVREIQVLERAPRSQSRRRRLIWISWFFAEPIIDPRETRLRRGLTAGVVGAALVTTVLLVRRAIDYHPVYSQRITAQEHARAEAIARQAASAGSAAIDASPPARTPPVEARQGSGAGPDRSGPAGAQRGSGSPAPDRSSPVGATPGSGAPEADGLLLEGARERAADAPAPAGRSSAPAETAAQSTPAAPAPATPAPHDATPGGGLAPAPLGRGGAPATSSAQSPQPGPLPAGTARGPVAPAGRGGAPARSPAPSKPTGATAPRGAGNGPALPAQRPATPAQKPAPPAQRPTPPAQKPAPPARRPTTPAPKPAPPVQKAAPSPQKPAPPAQRGRERPPSIHKQHPDQKQQEGPVHGKAKAQ